MQMSDTPETDSAILASVGQWSFVLKETCQRLERERDKAQALVAEMKQAIIWAKAEAKERLHRLDQAACERRTWLEAHEKMKRERDEAREDAKRATYDAAQETIKVSTIKSHWIEAINERDRYKSDVEVITKERDEARQDTLSLLKLIASIRSAVGDSTGKLMQDELVEYCQKIYTLSQNPEPKSATE